MEILKVSFAIGFSFILTACASSKSLERSKNQVTVLGSLHDSMLKNPKFTLRDFTAAIDSFKPDLILTEVRPEAPGPFEGSIDGGIEQSIVYAEAEHLNAEVVPTDWFTEEYANEAMKEDSKLTPHQEKKVDQLFADYKKDIKNESILVLESSITQSKVRKIYDYYEEIGLTLSRVRNEKICKNIITTLSSISGRRVMIIFGLDPTQFG